MANNNNDNNKGILAKIRSWITSHKLIIGGLTGLFVVILIIVVVMTQMGKKFKFAEMSRSELIEALKGK